MRIADKSKANSVFIKRYLFDKSYSFGIYIFSPRKLTSYGCTSNTVSHPIKAKQQQTILKQFNK